MFFVLFLIPIWAVRYEIWGTDGPTAEACRQGAPHGLNWFPFRTPTQRVQQLQKKSPPPPKKKKKKKERQTQTDRNILTLLVYVSRRMLQATAPVHKVVEVAPGVEVHGGSDGAEVEGGALWLAGPLETVEVLT